ncbi:uncharacterized protein LOC123875419 [Maniola jurtina]|uniref:uncharacterized protein LOC123875419 n=1 Tax=Maniola jurtina TaxID=191418 RepID=UPI001E68E431|nr:uncharacterized protein LOC123875419 [Maniola jurtina]
MVTLTNLIIRLIIGTMITYYEAGWFPLISTAMKIVNYTSILLCGINSCEQNYTQIDRIIRCIDHLLTNKKIPLEVCEALNELRELVITRPVSFNAASFYTLDYPTMLSMASAVVTYTIILLQNMQ